MSANQHTPGPWTAHWSKYREGCFIVQASAPSNRVLATFDGDGDGPDAEEIASAHLIAAAPEMLAALEKAEQFIANGVELGFIRMPDASTPDPAHDTLPAIRAAIAKAGVA